MQTVIPAHDTGLPNELPLVGRERELHELHQHLRLDVGQRYVRFVSGEEGVGKSRLVRAAALEAERRGWTVAVGQAYPVESGIAYALFGDAFLGILRDLGAEALAVLTRGGENELAYLFPALASGGGSPMGPDACDSSEFRTRLLWNFTEFLHRYSERRPLLVVLEDVHFADESSLRLLHFVARQSGGRSLRFIVTYTGALRADNRVLMEAERSLCARNAGGHVRLGPLSGAETAELIQRTFRVSSSVSDRFSDRLHQWTLGNPFFVDETLKALVESGTLHRRDGVWLGWEVRSLALPSTVRESIWARLARLGGDACKLVELASVVGGPSSQRLLARLTGFDAPRLLSASEEATDRRVLFENERDGAVVYDFVHPLVRRTVYDELGLARARLLHGVVAEAIQQLSDTGRPEPVDTLAYHFARASSVDVAAKSARYLARAGRAALARHADAEAANYLSAALATHDQLNGSGGVANRDSEMLDRSGLILDLARARQRQGRYDDALALWQQLLARAEARGSPGEVADARRQLGLLCYWSGRRAEALEHLEAGLGAVPNDDPVRGGWLRLTRGICLQELGKPADARADIEDALRAAEANGALPLMARAQRALAFLHLWTGPPSKAREHAREAIELARACGNRNVVFWSRLALACLEGLTGDLVEMARQIELAEGIADELRSPVLRIWTAEISIERAAATGEWATGIALGERAIALARSLNQRPLLPRLLVWTALIYLGRGDLEHGKELVDEAWELAMTHRGPAADLDVHTAVPAHIGRAAFHAARRDWKEAVRVGEAGLKIAERSGYVFWSIHHLLPLTAEAYLQMRDIMQADRLAKRLRCEAERLGHRLGLAWADGCDAIVTWLSGDPQTGARMLRSAAEALEAIPVLPDATRLRRQLAGRLADLGDREGALRELRRVHDTLERLGATEELEKSRVQFGELGVRPPSRHAAPGAQGLTSRELEVARITGQRRSNKAIGRALGISHRTVSTHLTNIYRKLGVSTRIELADMIREGRLT